MIEIEDQRGRRAKAICIRMNVRLMLALSLG